MVVVEVPPAADGGSVSDAAGLLMRWSPEMRSWKITPKASSHQRRHAGKERLPQELPHVGKERPSGVAQEGRLPAAADHGHRGPTVANGGCIGTVVPSSLKKMVRSSFELQCNEDEQNPFLPVEGLVSRRVSDLLVRVLT